MKEHIIVTLEINLPVGENQSTEAVVDPILSLLPNSSRGVYSALLE